MKLKNCKVGQRVVVRGDIKIECEIARINYGTVDVRYDTGKGYFTFLYVNPRFLKLIK
jgi:hypothetical protein